MGAWGERLAAAAVGALVVGILVALAGYGPERVVTGLAAVAAATLAGALLDDLLPSPTVEGEVAGDRPAPAADPLPVEPRRTVPPPPRIGVARTTGPAAAPAASATPPPRWDRPRRPDVDRASAAWAGLGRRDLVATYRSGGPRDVVCTQCGRSVPPTQGDRPRDCPAPLGAAPCPLTARADLLWTRFAAVPRVSPGDAHDLV